MMEKELDDFELATIDHLLKKHRREKFLKLLGIVSLVIIMPLTPSRRNREFPESFEEYLAVTVFGLLIAIPAFFIYFHKKNKNLTKDARIQLKVGTRYSILKKERFFSEKKYLAVIGPEEKIEVTKEDYDKINKGDTIITWKSKYAGIEFQNEFLFDREDN